jgi:hypothetical protein
MNCIELHGNFKCCFANFMSFSFYKLHPPPFLASPSSASPSLLLLILLVIFQIESPVFARDWTEILLLMASCIPGIIGMHHHIQLLSY